MSATDEINDLLSHRFLRMEVGLEPIDGPTFQPPTFANTGMSFYEDSQGKLSVVVESVASMANLLEATIWDEGANQPDSAVAALPWVEVKTPEGEFYTSSRTAAHRLYAYMLVNGAVAEGDQAGKAFEELLKEKLGIDPTPPIAPKLAKVVWEFDPLSIIHGVWISGEWSGRARLTRALSARIDAHDVQSQAVQVGGQKTGDHVLEVREKQSSDSNETAVLGEIPHHTAEVSAREIRAMLLLDLGLIRSYRLGEECERALASVALLQIRRMIDAWPRRRTRCTLSPIADRVLVHEPSGWSLPAADALEAACAELCAATAGSGRAKPLVVAAQEKKLKELLKKGVKKGVAER